MGFLKFERSKSGRKMKEEERCGCGKQPIETSVKAPTTYDEMLDSEEDNLDDLDGMI